MCVAAVIFLLNSHDAPYSVYRRRAFSTAENFLSLIARNYIYVRRRSVENGMKSESDWNWTNMKMLRLPPPTSLEAHAISRFSCKSHAGACQAGFLLTR